MNSGPEIQRLWDSLGDCRRVSAFLLVGILFQSFGRTATGQETIQITPDSTCLGCTILAEHVATLGALNDPTSPWTVTSVARGRDGHYYVGPTSGSGEIAVYGPDGRFARILGREGDGPGEFKGIQGLRIRGGDTLHILSEGRHTIMLTTGEVVATRPMSVGLINTFLVMDDGRALVGDNVETPDLFGLPAHIYDLGGRRVRSFGNSSTGPQGFEYSGGQRALSYTRNDRIWVNPYGDYRLELWDTAGVHVMSYVRDAPWLEPWTRTVRGAPFRVEPKARLLRVHEDSDGRLWMIGRVPERNWRPVQDMTAYERVYDSVVEVIDPVSGKLLVSERFERADQLFYDYIEENLVYSRRVEETGLPLIDIWRLSFQATTERRVP